MITTKALVLALMTAGNVQVAPDQDGRVVNQKAPIEVFEGRVVKVKDGDTLGVMKDGREVPIRISYIDAPEKSQDFGQVSKRALSDLCYGTLAVIHVYSFDNRTNRFVGTAQCHKQDVGTYMVSNGFAWVYDEYAKGQNELKRLEREANKKGYGLWSQPNPIEPKIYRKMMK